MDKTLNSKHIQYFTFAIMLLLMFLVGNVRFEPLEMGVINQILHPEYPKGEFFYSPYWNTSYLVAFLAKIFHTGDHILIYAQVFWIVQTALTVFAFTKLSNYVFENDDLTLMIIIMFFLLGQIDQVDQKTMAVPFHLMSICYFLRGKWLLSAIFTAMLFYIHVGMAIWWTLTSVIGVIYLFAFARKVSLRNLITYGATVFILALPVILFFLNKIMMSDSGGDDFAVQYYYTTVWYATSVKLFFTKPSLILISSVLIFLIFLVGYKKAKNSNCNVSFIPSIAIGVFGVHIIALVLCDFLKIGSAITLQLLRSFMHIEIFFSMFLAFLMARQIRNKNYLFFVGYVFIAFLYGFVRKWLGDGNYYHVLAFFYAALLVFEILENSLRKFKLINFSSSVGQIIHRKISLSLAVAIFLILLTVARLPGLKNNIKILFGVPEYKNATTWTSDKYLYEDITDFVNQNLKDPNTLIVTPFLKPDFSFYTGHNTFIKMDTPHYDLMYSDNKFNFREIMEEDLGHRPEYLLENYTDKNFREKWQLLWERVDEEVLKKWKKKYHVTHIVRDKKLALNLPVIYDNPYYFVYKVD